MIILRTALFLYEHGAVMSFQELGKHLNRNGYTTEAGMPYSETHGRGVAHMIHSLWAKTNPRDPDTATAIARAFVDESGNYSYE